MELSRARSRESARPLGGSHGNWVGPYLGVVMSSGDTQDPFDNTVLHFGSAQLGRPESTTAVMRGGSTLGGRTAAARHWQRL